MTSTPVSGAVASVPRASFRRTLPYALLAAVAFVAAMLLGGAVLVEAAANLGTLMAVALIVPHGVLEFPALWLAGSIGARWVRYAWRVATGDRSGPGFTGLVRDTAVVTTGVMILVAAAAVVEAHVTLRLAQLVS